LGSRTGTLNVAFCGMKLLLDQQLSRRLVPLLEADFPGTVHTGGLGLSTADDRTVWQAAKQADFILVSKDRDFVSLALRFGRPPLLVWLKIGNADVQGTANLIVNNTALIKAALADSGALIVELS
jgi:predicted nuclease of predicted toxin-antitoxin system